MTFTPYPDAPMPEREILLAEDAMRRGEISPDDLAWLMGLEHDESDKPVPRGFKSHAHFNAFKWHMEQRRLGKRPPRPKKRKNKAA